MIVRGNRQELGESLIELLHHQSLLSLHDVALGVAMINFGFTKAQIHILISYQAQVGLILKTMRTMPEKFRMTASTIDFYQGQACDIILLDFVQTESVRCRAYANSLYPCKDEVHCCC